MIRPSGKRTRVGFTLVELAIVLSIVGVVTAGLWRLSSNSTQQTKDQVTAQQHEALINAVKGFLSDGTSGNAWLQTLTPNTLYNLPLPTSNTNLLNCEASIPAAFAGFCGYLPPSFSTTTTNPYGQSFCLANCGTAATEVSTIQILTGPSSAAVNYSFMITTTGGTVIPDSDGGRISSLIGGEGGFIYSSAVCTPAISATAACGSMGAWSIPNITLGAAAGGFSYPVAAAVSGNIASMSSSAASSNNLNSEWLARTVLTGDDPTKGGTNYINNTMLADIFMGSYVAATDTPSVGTIPSIHLHSGYIEGNGAGLSPQLSLHANYPIPAGPTTIASSVVVLSNALPANDGGAPPQAGNIVTGAGCSALNNSGASDKCPAVLFIPWGDISVPNGIVSAQKNYSASDMRLKRDIHPIKDALSDVMRINPVNFTFKSNGSKSMGVIAQEIEKIYPQLVIQTKGTKYVEYTGLIGPLIESVQELKHQNDELKRQIQNQATQIKALQTNN